MGPPVGAGVDLEEVAAADPAEVQAALANLEPASRPPPQGFIVSITRGGKMRRLHFAGGCSRIPGEHYREWLDMGQNLPAPHLYTTRCLNCFPEDKRTAEISAEPLESSSDESSSSTSSSGGVVLRLQRRTPKVSAGFRCCVVPYIFLWDL